MAFTPKTWSTGEVLASAEMNRIETGIDDAHDLVATAQADATAAQADIDAHVADLANPHQVGDDPSIGTESEISVSAGLALDVPAGTWWIYNPNGIVRVNMNGSLRSVGTGPTLVISAADSKVLADNISGGSGQSYWRRQITL